MTPIPDVVPSDPDDEPPSREPRRDQGGPGPDVVAADDRTDDSTPVDLDALSGLLSRVLAAEGAPSRAQASLTLVDPGEIAELKVEHLDGDGGPTDVLSFPLDGTDPDAELVGDVVLCPVVAARQAAEHAGTVDDELALLVVHGGLHLVGWDHAEPDERDRMWDRERALLTALHRAPSRDPWRDRTP